MKKYLFSLFLGLTLSLNAYADGAGGYDPVAQNMGTAVTNVAASTTNSANGTIIALPTSPSAVRIWLTAGGNAGTTNGSSSVSNLVVKISTASGTLLSTNAFDTANNSNIKLTLPVNGAVTNTVSDWFLLTGARYIRVGQIENNTLGSVSNIQVIVGYPK